VNELEQAWTGVEEPNRAFIFDIVTQSNLGSFIIVCLPSDTQYKKLKGPVGIPHVPPEANIVI